LSYGLSIADLGVAEALRKDKGLLEGLNTFKGSVTYEGVAKAHNLKYVPAAEVLT
jgi:alanine dehydrogenase